MSSSLFAFRKEPAAPHPDCNIGIKCSNLLVFDLDCKDGIDGANDLRNIIQSVGKLPDSPIARTGSGGWHLFFTKPNVDIIGQKKLKWQGQKTGIDIQTGNQYIVAPPSIHPCGNPYQWITPPCPVAQLPQLPAEWIEQVLPKRQNLASVPVVSTVNDSNIIARCRSYVAAMPAAIQGQSGQSDLLRVANVIFHGFGLSEAEGWQLMLEYNCRCCPPWDLSNPTDEKDFHRKIRQAIEKPLDNQPFGYLRDQSPVQIQADISAICNTQTTTTEFKNVTDVTITLDKGDIDVTTRDNEGFRATAGGLKECTIEFDTFELDDDNTFTAIKDAWLDDTPLELKALSSASGSGPHGVLFGDGFYPLRSTRRSSEVLRNLQTNTVD